MSLEIGLRVGPYQVVAPLGAGGMGEVYRAHDSKLGRDVALKVLAGDMASNADHLRRFELEARAASALNHPNIITIYEIGRGDTFAYIAMELVDGRDLRSLMRGEALAAKSALRIAVKIADALGAAHERGIVHRDLKPENVMVSRDGFVKLLDFGLAKLVTPVTATGTTMPHTTPGAVFGTVGYMSPEQAAGRPTDFRADQFALGVMLYEMITGRLPFSEATAAETLAAIIRQEPKPVEQLNAAVTPDLARLIERCLAKDPDDRYASTRDLARDLREIRDRITHSSSPRHSGGTSEVRRRPLAAWVLTIAGGLAVTGGLASIALRRPPAAAPGPVARSLAVMPFRDLSGTPDGQLLADGISATIAARLAGGSSLRVAPLLGASAVPAGTPLEQIAQRSGSGMVLQGTSQRFGNQVRVSFAIVDPKSGTQVGADTVTGSANDVFALEDAVAERILQTLRIDVADLTKKNVSGLAGAEDQTAFIEAIGLLQKSRDVEAVDAAIERLEKLLLNARDSAAVNGWLGRALHNKAQLTRRPGLIEQATVYAERAAELDPLSADARVTLAQVRLASGRNEDAHREFERALAIDARTFEAVLGLGTVEEAMGRSSEAERLYRKAASMRPDSSGAQARLGLFYFARGQHAAAIGPLQSAAKLAPDSAGAHSNLGVVYQSMGRYEEALASHRRSLDIEPTAQAWSNIGTIEYHLGRFADACRSFERATAIAPSDYLVQANLADAYRWTPGAKEKSVAAYERAIELGRQALAVNSRDALVHAVIAGCQAKLGRTSEAAGSISSALKLNPTDANVLYSAAVVAELRGNADAAEMWLGRALESGYSPHDAARDPETAPIRSRSEKTNNG